MTTRLTQSTRPPPPSPSLVALLQLNPPSPILSPSDLSTSLTSGEIPILLSGSSPSTASLDSDQRLLPRSCESNRSRSTLYITDHDPTGHALKLSAIASTESLASFFGPVRKDVGHRLSLCWSSDVTTGDFVREGGDRSDRSLTIDHDLYHEDSWIGASMWNSRHHTTPEKSKDEGLVSSLSKGSSAHESYPTNDETLSIQDSTVTEGCILTCTSNSKWSSPGASKRAVPVSSRGSSYRSDTKVFHQLGSSTYCAEAALDAGLIKSLLKGPTVHINSPPPVHWTETPGGLSTRVQLTTKPRDERNVFATELQTAAREHTLPLFLRSPQTCVGSSQGYQQHSWLQNTTITLLIDQEGFRTARPVLRQIGVARWRLLDFGSAETDIVTFAPMTKQAFRFHYALFDGLPILRRLLVNGDETRDYLSKLAYLGLKTPGVYTVHGVEIATSTSTAPAAADGFDCRLGNQEPTKLFWQFDYSVEDRRAEQSGKSLDGEKLLIPLTFSCSPRLLHPSQGKRIKLMHIVKKTVAAKLTAEKMQPPAIHSEPAVSVTPTERAIPSNPSGIQAATQLYLTRSQAWNSHRRVQSNPRETPETTYRRPSSSLRRRRASSAGESHINANPAVELPARYILPPSRLHQLLEEYPSEGTRAPIVEPVPGAPLNFFSLKPSPRFRN